MCQNFQNTLFFLGIKKEKKIKNLGVGHDLMKFTKILTYEFLKKKIYIYIWKEIGVFWEFNKKLYRTSEIKKKMKIWIY